MSIAEAAPAVDAAAHERPRLLLVDDEQNVLAALRRALRPRGFDIQTADSGEAGVQALAAGEFDAVISDMRMPGMSGAEFLAYAREHQPRAVRILLTGQADLASAMAAVNGGEIFRFFCKPWTDEQLVQALQDGIAREQLRRERDALLALTHQQNERLQQINDELERRVTERTSELSNANERIKNDFMSTVRLFSSMVERRGSAAAGAGRGVARLVRQIALRLKMVETELQDTTYAALLEDIGKIALPDRLLSVPFCALAGGDRADFLRHPQHGASYLMALPSLHNPARILRALYESHDGHGTPDGLSGEAIPLGARVLRVASDYERLRAGALERQRPDVEAACAWMRSGSGTRYDPRVVEVLTSLVAAPTREPRRRSSVQTSELSAGMVLAADVVTPGGVLLLGQDHPLDAALIACLTDHEEMNGVALSIWVYS
jgi:response regulator RpfG family c-di-GMP phosphodiesterase